MKLKPHQRKAIDNLDNGKILYGDMGVGKSFTAAAYYVERESPRPVYVITTAKKRDTLDWNKEFANFGMTTEGSFNHGPLVVDSWNNLAKYEEVEDAFFIFDEQRVVGYGAWSKAFIQIAKHNRWILLSATPGDTWMDYIPVFIANGFYKNKTDFVRQHVVYAPYVKHGKVLRFTGVGKLVRLRNQLLVHMPYERHTTRETLEVSVGYDAELLDKVVKKRWHVFENRPIKNVSELFSVTRKVVNSDPSRLETVRALLADHSRLIVFYNFDYELEQLRTLSELSVSESRGTFEAVDPSCPTALALTPVSAPATSTGTSAATVVELSSAGSSERSLKSRKSSTTQTGHLTTSSTHPPNRSASKSRPTTSSSRRVSSSSEEQKSSTTEPSTPSRLTVAEWNGHRHDPIPQTERWVYLVQYAAGSEGWNCTETDAMCFYSLTYSWRMFYQAHGRIDRLDTPFEVLKYYYLVSSSWFDKAVWRALRAKRSFNEASYPVPG